jgi:hypothetical protein
MPSLLCAYATPCSAALWYHFTVSASSAPTPLGHARIWSQGKSARRLRLAQQGADITEEPPRSLACRKPPRSLLRPPLSQCRVKAGGRQWLRTTPKREWPAHGFCRQRGSWTDRVRPSWSAHPTRTLSLERRGSWSGCDARRLSTGRSIRALRVLCRYGRSRANAKPDSRPRLARDPMAPSWGF